MHSDALRCTQRHSEALRGNQRQSEVVHLPIRGALSDEKKDEHAPVRVVDVAAHHVRNCRANETLAKQVGGDARGGKIGPTRVQQSLHLAQREPAACKRRRERLAHAAAQPRVREQSRLISRRRREQRFEPVAEGHPSHLVLFRARGGRAHQPRVPRQLCRALRARVARAVGETKNVRCDRGVLPARYGARRDRPVRHEARVGCSEGRRGARCRASMQSSACKQVQAVSMQSSACDHQRSSEVIRGHQGSSRVIKVIKGHHRSTPGMSSKIIKGHQESTPGRRGTRRRPSASVSERSLATSGHAASGLT